MKKSKVYTRTGDAGQTSLVSGTRVDKCDCRIDAYGTIDELNSSLGVVLSFDGQTSDEAADIIRFIQHRLFSLGAYLADDRKIESCYVTADDIARIEAAIDEIDAQLPPLRQFLLPA
ncbi:MAG: ATP:cob(I)alamin adenosyltransferase, partial [Prevotella sp.]|nr:ATP:cob(I)alamin adenosyltransferase [Prevotella sp.]